MSYQERRALVSILSTIVISVVYFRFMFERMPDASAYSPEMFKYWGTVFVLLIPVTIVAKIIVTIVFSILNTIATREGEPAFQDECDRLIDLKSMRTGFVIFMIAIVLGIGSLALDMPPTVMFLCFFAGGIASDVASDVSQFLLYRRGV